MKRIKLVVVLILSLFFTMTNVSALVNTNIIGSIEGKYSFGNYNITDTNVYLYRIAELSSDEKFTYMQDFVLALDKNFYLNDEGIAVRYFSYDDIKDYFGNGKIEYLEESNLEENGIQKKLWKGCIRY